MRRFFLVKAILLTILPTLLLAGCGGVLPAHIKAVKVPNNVVFQARATASGSYNLWGTNFHPAAAVDGITFESHVPETMWLLPDATTGFLTIDPEGTVKIDRIRLLNTHNSGFNDRGTKDFHVEVVDRDGKTTTVWRDSFPAIGGEWMEKSLDSVVASRIVVHVDSYFNWGGGLTEIEVIGAQAPITPAVAAAPPSPPSATAPAVVSEPSSRFTADTLDISFPKGIEHPDDIAVIIGNADYGKLGKDIPNVKPAYSDAASFKKYAMTTLGVREGNIIDMRDATGAQMNSVFGSETHQQGQLSDWVRKGTSNVYVYYAGHGAPGGSDGNAYLIPSDADASRIEINGYGLKTLYSNLGRLPAKSVTVVLEACFSGSSQAGAVISNASPVFLKAKTPDIPSNITVIAAGASDQMASWENDGSNGLFTKYYLKGVSGEADADADGIVTNEELKAYLQETLTYYARRYYGRDQTAVIVVGDSQ
jgi:hypothetical protein